MYESPRLKVAYVIGPYGSFDRGQICHQTETERWNIRRKAEVIAVVLGRPERRLRDIPQQCR
jgi:hypothetical protein